MCSKIHFQKTSKIFSEKIAHLRWAMGKHRHVAFMASHITARDTTVFLKHTLSLRQ